MTAVGIGFGVEFPFQDRLQPLVLGQGLGPLSIQGVQTHQVGVHALVGRLKHEHLLECFNRAFIVVGPGTKPREPAQQIGVAVPQVRTLITCPLLNLILGQQVSRIEVDRSLVVLYALMLPGRHHRILEVRNVNSYQISGTEHEEVTIAAQEGEDFCLIRAE
jgi:hypothetical protein